MALIFVDGFDYFTASGGYEYLPGKWTGNIGGGASYTMVAGRHGGYAFQSRIDGSGLYKDLGANYETLIAGFAFWYTTGYSAVNATFFELMDSTTVHLYLRLNTSGELALYRGDGTLLAEGFSVLVGSTWYYIEIKAKISDTVGTCVVRANEVVQFSISGEDTRNGANAYINRVRISGTNYDVPTYIDDFIVLDTTGPAPFNDFLGFIRVDTIRPTGAGSNAEWVPSAGSNYQCVDETQLTAATIGSDYVTVSGEGKTDTYAMANAPVDMTGSIFAVATNVVAFKSGTAVTSVVPAMLIGGNMYSGESFDASPAAYTNYQDFQTVNPATSAVWTSGELNALEYGIIKKY